MSRNVVGSWAACRSHDKELRRMMDERRRAATERGRNSKSLTRLELVVSGAPAVLHDAGSRRRGGGAAGEDPFDARILLGNEGIAVAGDGVAARGSRLAGEHDFERYMWLVCAELQGKGEFEVTRAIAAKAKQEYLLPTQQELLKGQQPAVVAQLSLPAATDVDEMLAERIAARFGVSGFIQRLARLQREEEQRDKEGEGRRRGSYGRDGGREEENGDEDNVRLRDEEGEAWDELDQEEARERAMQLGVESKREKRESEDEPADVQAPRDETPNKRMVRMLAEQLARKRLADDRETARRAASVKTEVVFEAHSESAKSRAEERKDKDKDKDKKKKKKKDKKRKGDKSTGEKKAKKDPLDAALEALKKKHNL